MSEIQREKVNEFCRREGVREDDPRAVTVSRQWTPGVRTLRWLWRRQGEPGIPEIKPALLDNQVAGLLHYDDLLSRIPRSEVAEWEEMAREVARSVFGPKVELKACGSYRRGHATSGDVDMLLTGIDMPEAWDRPLPLQRLVDALHDPTKGGWEIHTLGDMGSHHLHGPKSPDSDKKQSVMTIACPPRLPRCVRAVLDSLSQQPLSRRSFNGWALLRRKELEGHPRHRNVLQSVMDRVEAFGRTYRRVDLKSYARSGYAFALLYFTGSDIFNRSMRLFARRCGYSLSDTRLGKVAPSRRFGQDKIRTGPPIQCNTEKEIFDALGLEYRAPEERDVAGVQSEKKARRSDPVHFAEADGKKQPPSLGQDPLEWDSEEDDDAHGESDAYTTRHESAEDVRPPPEKRSRHS